MADNDYPTARLLLDSLASEIRVRTYNLPPATYPAALQDAARLLDQKKNDEAAAVLLTALNTLAVIDRVTPLPLVAEQEAIAQAQTIADQDKDGDLKLLNRAKYELDRGKALGYLGNDPEYAALNQAITDLENQIKGNQSFTAALSNLKDRVAAFFKW